MTGSYRNNGKTTDRDASGRFAPGNPGKPKGTRHEATRAALALPDGEAEAPTRQAVTMALGGDVTARCACALNASLRLGHSSAHFLEHCSRYLNGSVP